MLVGDLIVSVRERINDLPRGLLPNTAAPTVSVVAAGGSTLPTGSYFVKRTFTNQWGETLATAEAGPFTVGANQGLQITAPLLASVGQATGIRDYFGIGAGNENQWQASTTATNTISTPGNPGIPPTRNTSFYPDVDGPRVNAYTMYRWLNDALEAVARICGGIPSMTGLATINTQPMYQLIGEWTRIDHMWWDGYQIVLGGRDGLFYRNVVPGVVLQGVLQQVSNQIIIELQPQPSRGGAVTTSTAPIGISDTSISLTDASGFKLPFGLAVIGTPPSPANTEIVAFGSISGGVLNNVQRGLGGTVQQAWASGVAVAEANLRFSGRMLYTNPAFVPGNSLSTIPVPSGWKYPLTDFMTARFREAENDQQTARALMQGFEVFVEKYLKSNKLTAGPRQVGQPGAGGLDTYPSAGLGGRLIIP